MKRKKNISMWFSFFSVVLFLTALTPLPVYASVVWSDNFDDGNFDGWTTSTGGFTCENGNLECTETSVGPLDWSVITHPSNVSYGTWCFDFFNPGGRMTFDFWVGETFDYYVEMISNELRLMKSGSETAYTTCEGDLDGAWFNVDVTMDESFNVDVFLNGSHKLHYRVFNPSEEAVSVDVWFKSEGQCMDNIEVSDTVDIVCTNASCTLEHATTSSTTPTDDTSGSTTSDGNPTQVESIPLELLAVGAGVIMVLVIAIILIKRK